MQELINIKLTVIVPIGKFSPYKHTTVILAESTTHSFCQFPNLLSSISVYGIDMIKPRLWLLQGGNSTLLDSIKHARVHIAFDLKDMIDVRFRSA